MTSAIVIRRTGSAIQAITDAIPMGDAVARWKKEVAADEALPRAEGARVAAVLEVVELRAVRSYKVRGTVTASTEAGDAAPSADAAGGRRRK